MLRPVEPLRFARTGSPNHWRMVALASTLVGLFVSCCVSWPAADPSAVPVAASGAVSGDSLENRDGDRPADRYDAARLLDSPAWHATGSRQSPDGTKPGYPYALCGDCLGLARQPVVGQMFGRSVGSLWASLQVWEVRLQV
ncbi:MAG: hypothetical protein EA381_16295 [Planctomycetaceae bacterium]|nr:MAG: hypothetical protein EA381_16295 [Planctomycetaceae bacterium]